ncbi:hypothetical protein P152DRAFT_480831 [Eremomyces bilateralis CBS 781.70]|uniref:DUF7918 domain-containing protein n=1 Tax=Eremomyces bilateralis CBS 781.70 TaxID=1392243 RepID=A0A6G1G6J7_9PEZI|nr:uncharacterized protein P152DRAFT_480831 [Eremomyces bilateralis CBS 781.70]KAF1813581.1 hypothetical protein P152DRAFT_480831 [Eremomyces bilateralis CBS 781.70]
MPTLQNLKCWVEKARATTKFREHDVRYYDGVVQSYLEIPNEPAGFCIRLETLGYIGPGLHAFVYIDGEYQTNRVSQYLLPPNHKDAVLDSKVSMVIRGKEIPIEPNRFLQRAFKFEEVHKTKGSKSDRSESKLSGLGTIEVVVLRCGSHSGAEEWHRALNDSPRRKEAVLVESRSRRFTESSICQGAPGFSIPGFFDGANDGLDYGRATAFGLDGNHDEDDCDCPSVDERVPANRRRTYEVPYNLQPDSYGYYQIPGAYQPTPQYYPYDPAYPPPLQPWSAHREDHIGRERHWHGPREDTRRYRSPSMFSTSDTTYSGPHYVNAPTDRHRTHHHMNHNYDGRPRYSVSARRERHDQDTDHYHHCRKCGGKRPPKDDTNENNSAQAGSIVEPAKNQQQDTQNQTYGEHQTNQDDNGDNNFNNGFENYDNDNNEDNESNNDGQNLPTNDGFVAWPTEEASSANEPNSKTSSTNDSSTSSSNSSTSSASNASSDSEDTGSGNSNNDGSKSTRTGGPRHEPFVQDYWKKWAFSLPPDPEALSSDDEANGGVYVAKKEDVPRIPEKYAGKHQIKFLMRAGKGFKYWHSSCQAPTQIDTLDRPFAVFRFFYRTRDALEDILDHPLEEDDDDYSKRLEEMTQAELRAEILRLRLEDSESGSSSSSSSSSSEESAEEKNSKKPKKAKEKKRGKKEKKKEEKNSKKRKGSKKSKKGTSKSEKTKSNYGVFVPEPEGGDGGFVAQDMTAPNDPWS